VVSEPARAEVFVDETAAGRTPLDVELARGSHTVRVALEGFSPAQVGVEVTDGAPLAPLRFLLQPLSASLTVTSQPSGAVVRLGDQTVGRTPIERMALPPGVYEVSLEHAGYARFTRTLAAEAGEPAVLDATLKRGRSAPPPRRVAAGDLVRPGTPGVTPPRRVQGEAPVYPPAAQTARVSGSVLVTMIVDENGLPTNLRVIESAGEILDRAVLEAVSRWHFEPARLAGVAVKHPHEYKVSFQPPDRRR
jgi:TonB family protein